MVVTCLFLHADSWLSGASIRLRRFPFSPCSCKPHFLPTKPQPPPTQRSTRKLCIPISLSIILPSATDLSHKNHQTSPLLCVLACVTASLFCVALFFLLVCYYIYLSFFLARSRWSVPFGGRLSILINRSVALRKPHPQRGTGNDDTNVTVTVQEKQKSEVTFSVF